MAVLRSGLVSVTFRKLTAPAIVGLVAGAGLQGIEWGGDIHVPSGQYLTAREVGRLTRDTGLAVASYGSYYRAGEMQPDEFDTTLKTAVALGAPAIRIWVGKRGSDDADEAYRRAVAADTVRIADLAISEGMRLACEWHGGTLTDTATSANRFFEEVGQHPAVCTWWQPRTRKPVAESLIDIHAALPHIMGMHVFHWDPVTGERLPLANGETEWRSYFTRAIPALPPDSWALLEFVRDESIEQFRDDAATLKRWIATGADSLLPVLPDSDPSTPSPLLG